MDEEAKEDSKGSDLNSLGMDAFEAGDYSIALSYFEKSLRATRGLCGERHPDTATAYSCLGDVFKATGDFDRALSYCTKAADIHKETLGCEHTSTASSINLLGSIYFAMGDYSKAK